MISAHIDYALMELFNLAFYGIGIDFARTGLLVRSDWRFRQSDRFCDRSVCPCFLVKNQMEDLRCYQLCDYHAGFFMWLALTLLQHAL